MTDKGRGVMQFNPKYLNRRIGRFTYKQILEYGEQTIANLNQSDQHSLPKPSYNVDAHQSTKEQTNGQKTEG